MLICGLAKSISALSGDLFMPSILVDEVVLFIIDTPGFALVERIVLHMMACRSIGMEPKHKFLSTWKVMKFVMSCK